MTLTEGVQSALWTGFGLILLINESNTGQPTQAYATAATLSQKITSTVFTPVCKTGLIKAHAAKKQKLRRSSAAARLTRPTAYTDYTEDPIQLPLSLPCRTSAI